MPGLSPRRYKAHPRFRGQPAVWGPLGQDRGPGFVDGDTYFVTTHSSCNSTELSTCPGGVAVGMAHA